MRRDTRTLVRAAFATVLGVLSVPLAASTEARAQVTSPPTPSYNPYPSGILPADLIRSCSGSGAKFETIFGRYFAEWQALTPTVPTSRRATHQSCCQTDMRRTNIGGLLNFDESISPFRNMPVLPATCPTPPLAGRSRPSI